jgi:hypothetical protein
MNGIFILIMLTCGHVNTSGQCANASFQEFSSRETCEAAIRAITANNHTRAMRLYCVKK